NTDRVAEAWPSLAHVIGYVSADRVLQVCDAVIGVQRDYGNRKNRARARFKYTIADVGLDWIKGEIDRRLGQPLEPVRPFTFTSNGDVPGWQQDETGRWYVTLIVPSGRLVNRSAGIQWLDGVRAVAQA